MGWRRFEADGSSMGAHRAWLGVAVASLLVSVIAYAPAASASRLSGSAPSRSWLARSVPSAGRPSTWPRYSVEAPRSPFARNARSADPLRSPQINRSRSDLRAPKPALSSAVRSGSGQISGTVTAAATKAAIDGIEVCAFLEESPLFESCTTTNASGEYTLSALEAGEYMIGFFSPPESGLDFVTQFYDEKATSFEAEPVSVGEGGMTTGVNARLHVGGAIKGVVTSAATAMPVGEIEVCAFEEELEVGACATTDAGGEYEILGLAGGSYQVQFSEPLRDTRNFATQYYDGKPSPAEAQPVTVIVEAVKAGIDAALGDGGQIAGTVTSSVGGAPLGGIEVCALSLSIDSFRCASTDARGDYDVTSLSTAEYIVGFESPTGEYEAQFYDEASSFGDAQRLWIEEGRATLSIDAALRLAPPQELAPPSISGSPVEGQTLTVLHGAWTGSPTSYRDEWGLCDSAGELKSCFTIADGESYTLGAADVGHTIRVRETAVNSAGESEFVISSPTAAVAAGPPRSEQGSSGPMVSPPTPVVPIGILAPQSGVLNATATVASAAELKRLLASLLAPTGKDANIRALLEHGDYPRAFGALSAGQLTISWYLVPKGAHLAAARPTLVARGHVSFAAPGAAKLLIRLTASGRALLKHAKQLKLTAHGMIAALDGSSVSATKSFMLKR